MYIVDTRVQKFKNISIERKAIMTNDTYSWLHMSHFLSIFIDASNTEKNPFSLANIASFLKLFFPTANIFASVTEKQRPPSTAAEL